MTANTLTDRQREALVRAYNFLLQLNAKREEKEAAGQDTVDGQTRPAASTEPLEAGADE